MLHLFDFGKQLPGRFAQGCDLGGYVAACSLPHRGRLVLCAPGEGGAGGTLRTWAIVCLEAVRCIWQRAHAFTHLVDDVPLCWVIALAAPLRMEYGWPELDA